MTYEELAASQNEEDKAFHEAVRARRGGRYARELPLTMDDVYEVLADSDNPEDVAYAQALKERGTGIPTSLAWALDVQRALSDTSHDERLRRYVTENLRREKVSLENLKDLTQEELSELSMLGHAADRLIAAYYDNLTYEELEANFADSEPVKMRAHPLGVLNSFGITFTFEQLYELRKRAGGDASLTKYIRLAALGKVDNGYRTGESGSDEPSVPDTV